MKMKIIILAIAFVSILVSCKKQIGQHSGIQNSADSGTMINGDAAYTREVAAVLEEVYNDNAACKEVYAAILSRYYQDERVLLKDLLFPSTSDLYNNKIFHGLAGDTGIFRNRFCEIVVKGNFPALKNELNSLLSNKERNSYAHDSRVKGIPSVLSPTLPIAIYFPYSERFSNLKFFDSLPPGNKIVVLKKPTLVAAQADADIAPGRAPFYCLGSQSNMCYKLVQVDDNYAAIKPTHIITAGAQINLAASVAVPQTQLVTRVYHGWSRLTKQMDRLISFTGNGGGSEIKVCRVNGFLRRVGEHIDDFSGDVVTLHYTRGEIRDRKWKKINAVWDPNWNYQNIEQVYAVYEEDTKGTRTLDGSLTTTLTLPLKLGKGEGSIGFKIEASTQDEIITQRKIDRKSYLRDGLNNQGWGFFPDALDFLAGTKDWPIYDGGTIWSYTMPNREY